MSEMPARIWAEDTRDGAWFGHPRSAYAVEFIRADIAERMAEALEAILFEDSDKSEADRIKDRVLARSALSAWKDGLLDAASSEAADQ